MSQVAEEKSEGRQLLTDTLNSCGNLGISSALLWHTLSDLKKILLFCPKVFYLSKRSTVIWTVDVSLIFLKSFLQKMFIFMAYSSKTWTKTHFPQLCSSPCSLLTAGPRKCKSCIAQRTGACSERHFAWHWTLVAHLAWRRHSAAQVTLEQEFHKAEFSLATQNLSTKKVSRSSVRYVDEMYKTEVGTKDLESLAHRFHETAPAQKG